MKILYVCHRFPFPPARGGKIRPFNMIRHLGRNHEVTVASLARSAEEARAGEGLRDYCFQFVMEQVSPIAAGARMLLRLPSPVPSSMGNFYSPRLARRIRHILANERFDLIFVHCSSVAQYVEDIVEIPKILDFGDMDSQKWLTYARHRHFPLSWGYWLEGRKLERAEKILARKFNTCTCTTRGELETLKSYGTDVPCGLIPNGVDLEKFAPAGEAYDPQAICFVGRMDYYPNQQAMYHFCAEVLPLIRTKRPGVKLAIVGANPSAGVRKLGNIAGVTVTGTVPDVRPYVLKSAIAVAPLVIARGTQNKILESLAMGVPVVASPSAAAGVSAVPGEHILVGKDTTAFADAVLGLLRDPDERRRFGEAGRARMESHHRWSSSMATLDKIIDACVAGKSQANKSQARALARGGELDLT